MADVHHPGTASLSPRAREILRRAESQLAAIGQVSAPPADEDEVLDILQEAIDQTRDHLMAIRDLLEHIARERSTPPR